MPSKKIRTVLIKDDQTSGCRVRLPFNPAEVFGKTRAAIKVTINGYTFRTTTFSTNGCFWFPVNKENREGAGISPGEKIEVLIDADTKPRNIIPPTDLLKALKSNGLMHERWKKLSYTHQKEHVRNIEDAKKPETRARRIAKTLEMLERNK